MIFSSLKFMIFFPVVTLIYYLIPRKLKVYWLLAASYYFYMSWNMKYVMLIATSTLVSYLCAIAIEKTSSVKKKRIYIAVALIISLGILFIFKYFNFVVKSIASIVTFNPVYLKLILPVGISFYTFQTLSYVVDVYKGKIQAERNLGVYAAFVSFFPQLVAGPIERATNLLPQIKRESRFNYDMACEGVFLIIWGLYKKIVIADNLAVWADKVYGSVSSYSGSSLLLATLFFTFQIYCDFSGYSDIARGSAKLFNIELMENFKSPYFSTSIKEFWGRWHISLSTWFRDYVYIPLGGNRVSKVRTIINLMITFLVSGLWHGANWTFVLWGGIHGIGQVIENVLGIEKYQKHNFFWPVRVLFTFLFVMLAWVFFRAADISAAFYIIKHIFVGISNPVTYIISGFKSLGINKITLLKIAVIYVLPLFVYDYYCLHKNAYKCLQEKSVSVRYSLLTLAIVLMLLFGYVGQSTFVYFQF